MEQSKCKVDFVSVIAELKNGRCLTDCSRKMTELTDAVIEHRKKGKLTLQLVIEPSGVTDGRVTETSVSWACAIVKPEADTGSSIFFVTQDGQLTRNDPDQMDLEYHEPEQARDNKEASSGRD